MSHRAACRGRLGQDLRRELVRQLELAAHRLEASRELPCHVAGLRRRAEDDVSLGHGATLRTESAQKGWRGVPLERRPRVPWA